MTDTQATLLALVKSALFGTAYTLSDGVDVPAVLAAARAHGATALAYYGAVNCGVDASSEAMRDAFARVCRELLVGERQTADVACLAEELRQCGADFMPLKGSIIRSLYPKQEMRSMGDADILIKISKWQSWVVW